MHYIFMPATPLWMITEDLLKSLYRARLTRNGVHYTMKKPQYPYPPDFYAHERYSQIRQHNDEIRNIKVLPAPPERTEEAWPLTEEAWPLRDESFSEERPTLPEEIRQAAWEACGQILFSGIEARSRRNSKNRRSDNGEAAHGNFI
ncbi:hypothetical protein HYFRA_00014131 [Hymenoscyphus fraxineus]|uniref:Uncharacterized protein n=1 Tax=Hymenoscyphus fraxineus TaxID=746836 RepID=A0A9N9LEL2_9HELO|nr:hypothetical protein HYFRA_00014131 [Hymenoscyphus fraxineus]